MDSAELKKIYLNEFIKETQGLIKLYQSKQGDYDDLVISMVNDFLMLLSGHDPAFKHEISLVALKGCANAEINSKDGLSLDLGAKSSLDSSIAFEIKGNFIDAIESMMDYWSAMSSIDSSAMTSDNSKYSFLDGIIFSILTMIDGSSSLFNSSILISISSDGGGEGLLINDGVMLHDMLYKKVVE